jgi:hypothetical protein
MGSGSLRQGQDDMELLQPLTIELSRADERY